MVSAIPCDPAVCAGNPVALRTRRLKWLLWRLCSNTAETGPGRFQPSSGCCVPQELQLGCDNFCANKAIGMWSTTSLRPCAPPWGATGRAARNPSFVEPVSSRFRPAQLREPRVHSLISPDVPTHARPPGSQAAAPWRPILCFRGVWSVDRRAGPATSGLPIGRWSLGRQSRTSVRGTSGQQVVWSAAVWSRSGGRPGSRRGAGRRGGPHGPRLGACTSFLWPRSWRRS